ncbi:DUF2489 domain-containing protein [Salinimonas lutimaris]|uniref:DUF2489 domain-containing protein n=1 Tax=Salinimonas lutimaris TaxID=914153 RepID=UPI0010C0C90A|nr:DUF2489 domain-containing protein [Salinimonas lutimaris]
MLWTIAIIIALIIILALGVYAGRLLFMLKQQNARQAAARAGRTAKIKESVILIAKAMEQQQCELSEGAIRICNLLNALPLASPPDFRQKFPHIHALFIAVSGFAVLEERKKLSKQEKRKQDTAREQIESEHESKVLDELPAIKSYCEAL